jgi:hypothetical protein
VEGNQNSNIRLIDFIGYAKDEAGAVGNASVGNECERKEG